MQRRQRNNDSLGLSVEQRKIVDDSIEELSSDPASEALGNGSKLAGLFYHPNGPCRTLAMAMSAGFDALHGREDNARAKLQRALDLVSLIAPEGKAYDLVSELVEVYGDSGDVESFVGLLREKAIPYLLDKLEKIESSETPSSSVKVMPHAIEDGEALPAERLTPREGSRSRMAPVNDALIATADQPQHNEEQEGGPSMESAQVDEEPVSVEEHEELEATATEEAVQSLDDEEVADDLATDDDASIIDDDTGLEMAEESDEVAPSDDLVTEEDGVSPEEKTDDADDNIELNPENRGDLGISQEEELKALEAAKVAMNANYSDVALKPSHRFDPDVDLEAEQKVRGYRRRSKAAEGLEWRATNAKAALPGVDEVAEATVAAEGAAGIEAAMDQTGPTIGAAGIEAAMDQTGPTIEQQRVYPASELPEGMLEVCRLVLRDIRNSELTGEFEVNVRISPDSGLDRPRRRRRRRRPRSAPHE